MPFQSGVGRMELLYLPNAVALEGDGGGEASRRVKQRWELYQSFGEFVMTLDI